MERQYVEIGNTIEKLKEIYKNNQELEIRIGDENSNPNEGFKCKFPINNYNEVIYSHIKGLVDAYYNKENGKKDSIQLNFYVGGHFIERFYYEPEIIEESRGLKK